MILDEEIKEEAAKTEQKKVSRAFKPKIDLKKCCRAWNCLIFCPENSIIVENGKPKIDYETCTGCLICLRMCPCCAISEERE